MKWNAAVKQIEELLAEGKTVEIVYHRKWMKNDSHFDKVDSVVEYAYNGQICKAVNTWRDGINESSHIIDEISVKEGE